MITRRGLLGGLLAAGALALGRVLDKIELVLPQEEPAEVIYQITPFEKPFFIQSELTEEQAEWHRRMREKLFNTPVTIWPS